MSGKLADIDVSARHVTNMLPTFPTKSQWSTPNLAARTSRICILKHLLIDISTWKCHCGWYLTISLNITGYAKRPLMVMSTWKSEQVCRISHKPASLPTNLSNFGWHAMDTLNNPTHLASGNTLHGPSGSTCKRMTLASNILVANTSSTSLLPFRQKYTKLLKIGKAISIVVSLSHGNTIKDMST